MTTQGLTTRDNEIREISSLFVKDMKFRINGIKQDNSVVIKKMNESMTFTLERYFDVIISNEYMENQLETIVKYLEESLSSDFSAKNHSNLVDTIGNIVQYFYDLYSNSLFNQRLYGNSNNYISNIKESIHQNCNRELMAILHKKFGKVFTLRIDNNVKFM